MFEMKAPMAPLGLKTRGITLLAEGRAFPPRKSEGKRTSFPRVSAQFDPHWIMDGRDSMAVPAQL